MVKSCFINCPARRGLPVLFEPVVIKQLINAVYAFHGTLDIVSKNRHTITS